MADYPCNGLFTNWKFNYIHNYPLNGGYNCQACWAALLSAPQSQDSGPINYGQYAQISSLWIGGASVNDRHYRNFRGWASFNLSGLNPNDVVGDVLLMSEGGYVVSPSYGVPIRMHDGTHLSGDDYDYAEIEDGEFLGGTLVRPFGQDPSQPWCILFNAAGESFIKNKAGGNAKIGFIGDTYAYPPPGCSGSGYGYQNLQLYYDPAKLYISITGGYSGYIWIEGDNFAYLDLFRIKRIKLGSTTGTTGKIAGHHSVEGNYLHYIDSSGNERRILGSLTGRNTGKTPGQISINYAEGGTKLCYIDSSGNERCFEGT